MAQSLFDKVSTLLNASLHGIVDRALQQNSIAVMDEYIREAQKDLERLGDSAASVGGSVRTLKRKYEEFSAAAEKLDRDIDTLIVRGKDDLAAAAQAELNTKQQLAQDYFEQWEQQEKQYQSMLNLRMKLESRLTTIKQEREQVKALIKLAESKKVATDAIKSIDYLANIGDRDISSFADQVRSRLDEADARLEMATRNIQEEIDEVVGSGEIDRQLEERRRRLLGSQGGGAPASESSGPISASNSDN